MATYIAALSIFVAVLGVCLFFDRIGEVNSAVRRKWLRGEWPSQ